MQEPSLPQERRIVIRFSLTNVSIRPSSPQNVSSRSSRSIRVPWMYGASVWFSSACFSAKNRSVITKCTAIGTCASTSTTLKWARCHLCPHHPKTSFTTPSVSTLTTRSTRLTSRENWRSERRRVARISTKCSRLGEELTAKAVTRKSNRLTLRISWKLLVNSRTVRCLMGTTRKSLPSNRSQGKLSRIIILICSRLNRKDLLDSSPQINRWEKRRTLASQKPPFWRERTNLASSLISSPRVWILTPRSDPPFRAF